MSRVIIFGVKDTAQLAKYYLDNDTDHQVVAFSVSKDYLPLENTFEGLPVLPFEDIENHYPASNYNFFAPMTHRRINRDRATIYHAIKEKGYQCISYISSKALTHHNKIGENCFILENNVLQPFSNIGNNVMLWSGNHIGHHSTVGDHAFIASHVVVSGHATIESHCFIGVNASVKDYTHVAEGSYIGMDSSINKDTEPWQVYVGSPARKTGKSSKEIDY